MTNREAKAKRTEIAEYCRTHTAPEAAERFGVGRVTIEKACREQGVTCRMAHLMRGVLK
jgi:hypothetical protein